MTLEDAEHIVENMTTVRGGSYPSPCVDCRECRVYKYITSNITNARNCVNVIRKARKLIKARNQND